MQTFLPIASLDFALSAKVIDNKRLNKQALEGWQIMLNLLELDPQGYPRKPKGWSNHPAVKMWRDNEPLLYSYVMAMVREWKSRGFNSTLDDKATATFVRAYEIGAVGTLGAVPNWMQDGNKFEAIASTHRLALLSKDYEWYSQFHWPEDTGARPETYEYIWS